MILTAQDVTHCCQNIACTSRLLELGPDEATITTRQSLTGSVCGQDSPGILLLLNFT